MQKHNCRGGQRANPPSSSGASPTTESRNPRSMNLDMLDTEGILTLIIGRSKVAQAVARRFPHHPGCRYDC